MSYSKWYSMSDLAISKAIGNFIRQNRLNQNRTQDEVAKQAGISRSTLSLLERGEPVTLPTLIRVLRILELLHVMDGFEISRQISPLTLAKEEKSRRYRARGRKGKSDNPEIKW
jgi:transcriptional regulator with XRE-family HTH domain